MNKTEMLRRVAEFHQEWISTVKAHGERDFAEDLVQEMYLKIHRYTKPEKIFKKDGSLQKGYIFFTLKTILHDYREAKSKIKKETLDSVNYKLSEEPNFYDYAYGKFLDKIDEEIDSWHWYNARMFNLYKEEYKRELSLRKLAKGTGISWVSIHNTIKKCKDKLQEKFSEDWEDLQNGDHEHLTLKIYEKQKDKEAE